MVGCCVQAVRDRDRNEIVADPKVLSDEIFSFLEDSSINGISSSEWNGN